MANISSINLPDGSSYNFKDSVSGYISNTGVYGIYYGTCSTAAGTAAKVATLTNSDGFSLTTGVTVAIKFTNANGIASPTLNVNSTGAKSIKRYGTTNPSTSAATSWNAGSVVLLIFDGTNWVIAGWLNSTYSEISVANITNGSSSTTGLVTGRRAKSAVEAFAPVKSVNGSTGTVTIDVPSVSWTQDVTTGTKIASITIDDTTTDVYAPSGGMSRESDPVFTASPAYGITSTDISNWNSAEANVNADWNATSGDAQILNKPTIPTKTSDLTNDSGYLTEPTMNTSTVSSGGSGTWRYRTWPSGWQEAWYQGSIQFTAAASSAGGWYRSTKNFDLPIAFADDASILVSGATSGRVFTHGGIKTSGTQFEAQILGGAALAANTYSGWNVYVAGYGR